MFVSWERNPAVETKWSVFAQYWSDFCYPASDDVLAWRDSRAWVLLYHHEEFFQFGLARNG
ncbi:MAG: hypothetical protein ACKVQA_00765 [Burkholderiales bacterium]